MSKDVTQQGQAGVETPMPNRSAFAERYKKRHHDRDFEDKEDRYQQLNDDFDLLDQYEENGRALGQFYDNNRWLAAMTQDLRDNPDLDPITWMADNGVDIEEALKDEDYRKKIADHIQEFQQKQTEGEAAQKEMEENLNASADNLKSLGLSDDENMKLWKYLFEEVIDPAQKGDVSADTWKMVQKAMNYDSDVETARQEGGMRARNEKIRNQVKRNEQSDNLPPSLGQGGGQATKTKPQPKKSEAGAFFEGLS